MTLTELRSDWDAQIPFPGPRIVSLFTRPFSLQVWGLGTRLVIARLLTVVRGPSYVYTTLTPGIFDAEVDEQLIMSRTGHSSTDGVRAIHKT